jgi:type IV pilus assembly protein PilV
MARRSIPLAAAQSRTAGFSMIEVLITLVLLSFGLLGLVALQTRAVQTSVGAEDSNRAALLANEIATTMWLQNTVNLPSATVDAWETRVETVATGGLPNGQGTVAVTGNVARITVTWRPPHEADGRNYRYVTEVLIP